MQPGLAEIAATHGQDPDLDWQFCLTVNDLISAGIQANKHDGPHAYLEICDLLEALAHIKHTDPQWAAAALEEVGRARSHFWSSWMQAVEGDDPDPFQRELLEWIADKRKHAGRTPLLAARATPAGRRSGAGRPSPTVLARVPRTTEPNRPSCDDHRDVTVVVGAQQRHTEPGHLVQQHRRRVPVVVVQPDADHREPGLHRGQEVRVGVGRAVVRHLEHVGAQVGAASRAAPAAPRPRRRRAA